MAISIKTRKLLWGRAAMRCSFPDCSEVLCEIGSVSSDPDAILGEEAHICAKSPGGPRFSGDLSNDRIDHYLNLILLCANHHKLIDGQPNRFPPDAIKEMKRSHEVWVQRLLEKPVFHDLDSQTKMTGLESNNGDFIEIAQRWKIGDSVLLLDLFGSPPTHIGENWWRGSGITFIHQLRPGYSKTLCSWSEAEFDVDYRVHDSTLTIIEHTYDPATDSVVRFCEHQYRFSGDDTLFSKRILFMPEQTDATPAEIWGEIAAGDRSCSETAMYEIRNAGLQYPHEAIDLFRKKFDEGALDGAVAEVAHFAIRDLQSALEAATS